MKKRHSFDINYFDKIDSEDKAYFLGLLYADGYNIIHSNTEGLSICLQEEDCYILELLKEKMKSDYPIIQHKSNNKNSKNQYMFYVYSKGFKEKLENVGIFQRKTYKLIFPSFLKENLIKHFIRGYFDGDGCIWNGKRKQMLVKDNKHKNGERIRIVHNVKFTFTGNTFFIKQLQEYLHNKLELPLNKLYFRHKDNLECATIEYSGRRSANKLYNYMYNSANIYLKRKKEKFEEINKRLTIKHL